MLYTLFNFVSPYNTTEISLKLNYMVNEQHVTFVATLVPSTTHVFETLFSYFYLEVLQHGTV